MFSLDVNECNDHNGFCQQICENAVGSFVCVCRAGFRLNEDKRTCSSEYDLDGFFFSLTDYVNFEYITIYIPVVVFLLFFFRYKRM